MALTGFVTPLRGRGRRTGERF